VPRRDFDIDAFLARPLTARLATYGPAVRPVWYLWEQARFWVLVGPWNGIPAEVEANPHVALGVDTCELSTGECLQVVARGVGELIAYDRQRGRRKLERYLGPDVAAWDGRFRISLRSPRGALVAHHPALLTARDLSFAPSLPRVHPRDAP
jgi:hypothetical protein